MKFYWLAGAALALIAAPANARDNSAYFGIEIGGLFANDSDVQVDGDDFVQIDHKFGVDGDLIAGYDFGMFRAEIEGSHKWAKHDDYSFVSDLVDFPCFSDDDDECTDGHSRAYSLMANAMVDFGKDENVNFYVGGGLGIAWVRQTFNDPANNADIEDSGLAWQLIAGVRGHLPG